MQGCGSNRSHGPLWTGSSVLPAAAGNFALSIVALPLPALHLNEIGLQSLKSKTLIFFQEF